MDSSSLVLDSAEFVVQRSKDVSIPAEGIESLANIVRTSPHSHESPLHLLQPPTSFLRHNIYGVGYGCYLSKKTADETILHFNTS